MTIRHSTEKKVKILYFQIFQNYKTRAVTCACISKIEFSVGKK